MICTDEQYSGDQVVEDARYVCGSGCSGECSMPSHGDYAKCLRGH